jgi:EAL domain-containing protein (putative c-di-GMP-specific phosphodiesterase class I)
MTLASDIFTLPFMLTIQPTYIKLAREVVHSCNSEKSFDVLKKIIELFREMGIHIIAEGIESEVQFELMRPVVDGFQGYWFALPGRMQEDCIALDEEMVADTRPYRN